jgi:cellulose biosynthesis protein BcsQ
MGFVDHIWQAIFDKFGQQLAVLVVWLLGALGLALLRPVYRFGGHVARILYSRSRALGAVQRAVSREGTREGQGVWLTAPIQQPEGYTARIAACKILAIANLKGGVGKTTLTANLGAFFARDWGLSVLLIDLDFQGSLSSMAFPQDDWLPADRQDSTASKLISGDIAPDILDRVAKEVPLNGNSLDKGRLKVITAHYDLAQADTRILVVWLLQRRPRISRTVWRALVEFFSAKFFMTQDVRYTLADILHSDAVRQAYDLIIIDCPPRLTTSEIQAFCASSHLLIPTIFDRTSAEAVVSLCEQVETLRVANICPQICRCRRHHVETRSFGTNASPNVCEGQLAKREDTDRCLAARHVHSA